MGAKTAVCDILIINRMCFHLNKSKILLDQREEVCLLD